MNEEKNNENYQSLQQEKEQNFINLQNENNKNIFFQVETESIKPAYLQQKIKKMNLQQTQENNAFSKKVDEHSSFNKLIKDKDDKDIEIKKKSIQQKQALVLKTVVGGKENEKGSSSQQEMGNEDNQGNYQIQQSQNYFQNNCNYSKENVSKIQYQNQNLDSYAQQRQLQQSQQLELQKQKAAQISIITLSTLPNGNQSQTTANNESSYFQNYQNLKQKSNIKSVKNRYNNNNNNNLQNQNTEIFYQSLQSPSFNKKQGGESQLPQQLKNGSISKNNTFRNTISTKEFNQNQPQKPRLQNQQVIAIQAMKNLNNQRNKADSYFQQYQSQQQLNSNINQQSQQQQNQEQNEINQNIQLVNESNQQNGNNAQPYLYQNVNNIGQYSLVQLEESKDQNYNANQGDSEQLITKFPPISTNKIVLSQKEVKTNKKFYQVDNKIKQQLLNNSINKPYSEQATKSNTPLNRFDEDIGKQTQLEGGLSPATKIQPLNEKRNSMNSFSSSYLHKQSAIDQKNRKLKKYQQAQKLDKMETNQNNSKSGTRISLSDHESEAITPNQKKNSKYAVQTPTPGRQTKSIQFGKSKGSPFDSQKFSFNSNVTKKQNSETKKKNIATEKNVEKKKAKEEQIKEAYEVEPVQLKKKKKKVKQEVKIDKKEQLLNNKIINYHQWIKHINFSNHQMVEPINEQFIPYKVVIGKGNNSQLIKNCVRQRWWLQVVESVETQGINFIWTQLRMQDVIESIQPNKQEKRFFENNPLYQQLQQQQIQQQFQQQHQQNDQQSASSFSDLEQQQKINDDTGANSETDITSFRKSYELSKSQSLNSSFSLKSNMSAVQLKAKRSVSGSNDLQKSISQIQTQQNFFLKKILPIQELKTFLEHKELLENKEFCEIQQILKQGNLNIVTKPQDKKLHNHLENQWNLSNKKALFYNLQAYYQACNKNCFEFIPLTFHIQNGTSDPEYKRFLEYWNKRQEEIKEREILRKKPEMKKKLKKIRSIWIVKPGEVTNQGHGITVQSDLQSIENILNTQGTYKGRQRTWILQQYIDNPLLYMKRKFDIRCYVLLTTVNGILKGYWYEDGYIRTSCKEFSLQNLNNKFVHLTNDAVQKKNEDYGKFESGNKISYQEFQRYLDLQDSEKKVNFFKACYPKMKQIAADCINAVAGKIDPHRRENSFELFGLDYMIDESFKVQLLEVNTNPCLALSSPLLARIIPHLIENTFRIAIDSILPPPALEKWPSNKKVMIPDYLMEHNKFELIFDEFYEGFNLQKVMQTVDNKLSNDQIFQIQEEEEGEEEDDENEQEPEQMPQSDKAKQIIV